MGEQREMSQHTFGIPAVIRGCPDCETLIDYLSSQISDTESLADLAYIAHRRMGHGEPWPVPPDLVIRAYFEAATSRKIAYN